jgi:hypothetical protein
MPGPNRVQPRYGNAWLTKRVSHFVRTALLARRLGIHEFRFARDGGTTNFLPQRRPPFAGIRFDRDPTSIADRSQHAFDDAHVARPSSPEGSGLRLRRIQSEK